MDTSVPPATEHLTHGLVIAELVGRFSSASNATFLGKDPDDQYWVYKPEVGVRPLRDFPSDSLANREILAYEVSACMELGLVPKTVRAFGPLGAGAAQRYLQPDPDFDQRVWFRDGTDPRLWPVAVFDLITNNADRKLGHLLVESPGEQIFAIDHGLTFHHHDKLRTVLWGFAGERIPDHCLQAVDRLREALHNGMRRRTGELLDPPEAEALLCRTQRVLDDPTHPHPPADRPALPWPLW